MGLGKSSSCLSVLHHHALLSCQVMVHEGCSSMQAEKHEHPPSMGMPPAADSPQAPPAQPPAPAQPLEPSTSPVAPVPMTQRPYGTITSSCSATASQGRGQISSTAGGCGSLWVCKSSSLCRNSHACCVCYAQDRSVPVGECT